MWKSPISSDDVLKFKNDLYKAALSPGFILRKILSIRGLDDVAFFYRAAGKLIGHLLNSRRGQEECKK